MVAIAFPEYYTAPIQFINHCEYETPIVVHPGPNEEHRYIETCL